MSRGHVAVGLFLLLTAWPVLARQKPSVAPVPTDRAIVEQTIRDNIAWALTKDRTLAERTMAHDANLFMFNPDSKPTIGWDELVKNFAFWMDPRFKAISCDVRELRLNFSRSGDVAWWSAILDDLGEWDGKPTGWKDTRWTGVLEKRDGAWVIVQMHFSFASDKVRAEALASSPAFAQTLKPTQPDLGRLAAGQGAQVFNRSITAQKEGDRTVARLDARAGDGGALIDAVQLGDGVIEVDLRGKDVAQQSFLGIAFHVVDWTTYDAVYFRPFNFRAEVQAQRSHSVQYISHPANTWQKLRAERPGQFEKALDPAPDPNGWFHARIVLAKSKVEVYVNGVTTPSLVVDDLGEAKSGGVALWAGNGSDGAYASLTITPTAPPGPPPVSRQTIFQAAATGNLARLRTLVEADAGAVNQRMANGLTPLHLAAGNDQRQTAEYLISKGADVNAVARHSGTPLDVAYESERPEIVRWLESKGGRFTPLRFDVATLTPAVHRLAFPWGMMNNVLVFSGTDGAVIVDSGFSTRALDEMKKEIARFSPAGVRYVINSHNHGDHVAGNALAPGAAAVITAATLAAPTEGLSISRQTEPLKGRSGRMLPAGYTWRTGGADITLIPRPGLHSDTDLIVYFPGESVVAMGDLLLSESVPAVNDLSAYLAFLDDVLDVFPENTTFVSGHGRDLDAAGVRAYRDTLSAMIDIVRTNLAAGRTAEQMMKDDVLNTYKARYSLLDFLNPDTLIPRAVTALQKGTLK